MIATALFNNRLKYRLFSLTCFLLVIGGIIGVDAASGRNGVNTSPANVAQKPLQSQNLQKERTRIENQLADLEAKIRKTDSKIRDFREKNQVVDLATEVNSNVKTVNSINQEITTASAQLAAEKSRMAKMQSILGTKVINRSLVDLQKSGLSEALVMDYFKSDYKREALEQQIKALVYIASAHRDRASRFPQLEQTQSELNRQREGLLATYKTLRTNLDQLWIMGLENQFSPEETQISLLRQIRETDNQILKSEDRIRAFREKHQVVSLPAEAKDSVNTINIINRDIINASAQLATEKYRIAKMQTFLGVKTVSKNLLSLEKSAWHKAIVKDYLEADFQRQTLEQRIQSLVYIATAYRDRANRLPQLEQAQQELYRGLEINLVIYRTPRAKLDKLLFTETASQFKDTQSLRLSWTKDLTDTETRIKDIKNIIMSFHEKNQIVDLSAEADQTIKTINAINKEIVDASSQLVSKKYQIAKLQAIFGTTKLLASQTPEVKEAISALQKAEAELAVNMSLFTNQNYRVIDLRKKIQALEASLLQAYRRSFSTNSEFGLKEKMMLEYTEASIQKSALERRINVLVGISTAYRDRAKSLPRLEQKQRELNRLLERSTNLAKVLRAKLQT